MKIHKANMAQQYQVVRTYPSRQIVAKGLTEQDARNKASLENMGSDSECFTFEPQPSDQATT